MLIARRADASSQCAFVALNHAALQPAIWAERRRRDQLLLAVEHRGNFLVEGEVAFRDFEDLVTPGVGAGSLHGSIRILE